MGVLGECAELVNLFTNLTKVFSECAERKCAS
jgi:hypothetical protein